MTVETINIGQVKSMLHEIDSMSPGEHHNIIRILDENKVHYTENDNGIFVKVNELSLDTIREIYNYVEEIRTSKKDLECAIRSLDSSNAHVCEPFPVNTSMADSGNVPRDSVNIEIEDWKKEIIEKMRLESKSRNKKKKVGSKATSVSV